METVWERGNWVNSGLEYVDRGVLIGPVFLLHNYESSTFGAALLGLQGWLGEALRTLGLVCRKCPRAVGPWGKEMGRTSL